MKEMQKLQYLIVAVEAENLWTGGELRSEDTTSNCFLSARNGMPLLLDQSRYRPATCSLKSTLRHSLVKLWKGNNK